MIVRHYFSQGEVFKLQLFGGVDTQKCTVSFFFLLPSKRPRAIQTEEREKVERERERKRGVE